MFSYVDVYFGTKIFYIEEDTYKKTREREEILKKLVNSQEIYIKELESKRNELENELQFTQSKKSQDNADARDRAAQRDWQREQTHEQVFIYSLRSINLSFHKNYNPFS